MADCARIACIFTFLYINTCYGGLPGLQADHERSIKGADTQHIENALSVDKMKVRHAQYKCHQCESPGCTKEDDNDVKYCYNSYACFKASVKTSDGVLTHSRGCFSDHAHFQFTCLTQGVRKRHASAAGQLNVTCCNDDLCNGGSFPSLDWETQVEPLGGHMWTLWGCIIVVLVGGVCAVVAVLLLRSHRLRASRAALHKLGPESEYYASNVFNPPVSAYYDTVEGSQSQNGGGLRAVAAGDSTLREYLDGSVTSGSGSGLPLMVQRTLAKQITLHECVGKGRYGEVWRGMWNTDSVAVKIFFSRDEASWQRETEIYSTVLLRHANILAYIGSDMISRNSCTQLWLITHFHPLGSLYEHLNRATFTRHQMMVICLSIVNGLLHLHTEIHGTQGKPGIAHRDIKTKNILMKVNGECCIGDFGLAVTREHVATDKLMNNPRQGTKRYMSPEILDQSMNLQCFEAFVRCDIYALGLVLWEVVRRVYPSKEYRAPYHELVPADPSFEEMRKIVCVDQARPELPVGGHPTMSSMASLIRECWHHNPSVRLPALRIKKTLLKIAGNDNSIQLDDDNEVSL